MYAFDENTGIEKITANISIEGMTSPRDIAICHKMDSIYIVNGKSEFKNNDENCLFCPNIDGGQQSAAKYLKGIPEEPYTLSITHDGCMIMLSRGLKKIRDYNGIDQSGKFSAAKIIKLPEEMENLHHAIKTYAGNYVVSHGYYKKGDKLVGISKVDRDGKLLYRFDCQGTSEVPSNPVHLALHALGYVFVALHGHGTVIILDQTLQNCQDLINDEYTRSKNQDARGACRVCYVPNRCRLLIGWGKGPEVDAKVGALTVLDIEQSSD